MVKGYQYKLDSNFLITNFFSKQMIKKKWGRIVNITSVVGHTGNAGSQITLLPKQVLLVWQNQLQ